MSAAVLADDGVEIVAVIFIALIYRGIFAVACGAIAKVKGRNVAGWAVAGFFIDFIGLIIVAVLPNLKDQAARDRHIEEENRRLREQLRQERIKLDALRTHTVSRLDAHDQHLGLDTHQMGAGLPDGSMPHGQLPAADPLSAFDPAGAQQAVWYYGRAGVTNGPITAEQLRGLLRSRTLGGATLVWAEHLGTWRAAREVPEFIDDTSF